MMLMPRGYFRISFRGANRMDDPRAFNRPDRSILPDTSMDRLGLALLALTRELWVMKDRMTILEAVLANNGIDATAAIEQFQPDEALAKRLDTDGTQLIQSIVDVLADNI